MFESCRAHGKTLLARGFRRSSGDASRLPHGPLLAQALSECAHRTRAGAPCGRGKSRRPHARLRRRGREGRPRSRDRESGGRRRCCPCPSAGARRPSRRCGDGRSGLSSDRGIPRSFDGFYERVPSCAGHGSSIDRSPTATLPGQNHTEGAEIAVDERDTGPTKGHRGPAAAGPLHLPSPSAREGVSQDSVSYHASRAPTAPNARSRP